MRFLSVTKKHGNAIKLHGYGIGSRNPDAGWRVPIRAVLQTGHIGCMHRIRYLIQKLESGWQKTHFPCAPATPSPAFRLNQQRFACPVIGPSRVSGPLGFLPGLLGGKRPFTQHIFQELCCLFESLSHTVRLPSLGLMCLTPCGSLVRTLGAWWPPAAQQRDATSRAHALANTPIASITRSDSPSCIRLCGVAGRSRNSALHPRA